MEIAIAIVIAVAGIAVLELAFKPPCCPHEGELHLDGARRTDGAPVHVSARELVHFVLPMLLAAASACVFFISATAGIVLAGAAAGLFALGRKKSADKGGGDCAK